ncbi:hypothetical protein FHS83_002560 [Rhizomicrobium palustre]|uniref:Uncharacterized protein n=1 Tax=Rhizomicrobium palustre TaxID=189966 RepID=A0A846N1Z9_9PROT|nr:hypothetical protein [Rhizomicrobium palustre]NIK89242.1 hypothetical protein [Rhizomicrobium palustre]
MSQRADSFPTTIKLLKAVAGELRELAHDTARFGETLTESSKLVGCDASLRLLQKFDLFHQSLEAHAVLIDALSGHIDDGTIEKTEINELLHHVPFFSVRERLRAMVTGEKKQETKEEEESGDFLFFND